MNSNLKYILSRTVQTVFLLWFVLTFMFLLLKMMPGDITSFLIQTGASEEAVQEVRAQWGLDDPLHIQYIAYMTNFLHGDAGTSIQFGAPVIEVVKDRILNSFILVAPAITAAYIVGSILGAAMGRYRDSIVEKVGSLGVLVTGTIPEFFLGMILIIIFASHLGWFPTSGMVDPMVYSQTDTWWGPYLTTNFAFHYVLPFTAIFLRFLHLPALIMRTSAVEVLGQNFIYYHRMTGLKESTILKHIGKHATLPVITMYPISMARAISGLILIEVVFNWPGIGATLVEAVLARDYPVVQFVFFLVAAFVIIANFAVDIIYGVIDPRVNVSD